MHGQEETGMRVIVFGTGGVGGYFGTRLAEIGEDVWFIARGEHLRALQSTGLRVDSPKGNIQLDKLQATGQVGQVENADVVLVCVKAWQVPEVALAIQPVVGPDTVVVPLENGVEAPNQLAEVLGTERVMGGLCRIASQLAGPGFIRHLGIEPYIAFAELDGRSSQRSQRLLEAFQKAGVKAEIPADIWVALWDKFMFIAAVSGLGAIARVPIGTLRTSPGTRRLLQEVMQEIDQVASAEGVRLPPGNVSKTLALIDSLPEPTTASMQRDIMDGRPSELEAQNGAVVRLGEKHGIPTPANRFIYDCLLPQELKARGTG
jgi:2-dehydropantoate 2-reductase